MKTDFKALDAQDPLSHFRDKFFIPKHQGKDVVYFVGNSLGLQPKLAKDCVVAELEKWEKTAVQGHFTEPHPWVSYHQPFLAPTARIVGAREDEVIVMNTLTVNLHLMLGSFFRPSKSKFKILIEADTFSSDRYAVTNHLVSRGLNPSEALVLWKPEADGTYSEDMLEEWFQKNGDSIALVLLGNVNYLTGQAFDMARIVRMGHSRDAIVGFDLAHGAGNLALELHDDDVDFAVWCSYKYLNGGPGTLGGTFVHSRHGSQPLTPRPGGWWGHQSTNRFTFPAEFEPMSGAQGWQLSNPPILSLAALRASYDLFDEATVSAFRKKSILMTQVLESTIEEVTEGEAKIATPKEPDRRGCQLSVRTPMAKALVDVLGKSGIWCDYRSPDYLRMAPVPLYNRFSDIEAFGRVLGEQWNRSRSSGPGR